MKAVLVGSGPVYELPDLTEWKGAFFIGVDGGSITLLSKGILPYTVVGDFDSVTLDEYEALRQLFPELEKVASEKDETDTELGLRKAMELKPDEVIVAGVTGGRLDHYMSALHAVYQFQQKHPEIRFSIRDKQNKLQFLFPGAHTFRKNRQFKYVSFYPFTEEVAGLTLQGFKYGVADEAIPFGSTRFTSNELLDEGTVSFHQGVCLMVESEAATSVDD